MKFVSFFPTNYRKPATTASIFENSVNDFFRDFPTVNRNLSSFNRPAVNITESEDSYVIEVAAPGLRRQDFEVKVDKELLIVSARKEESTEEKNNYTRREFNYFEFERSFLLPDTIDVSAIKANAENGILRITLSKKEEAKPAPARVIEIA